MYSPPHAFANLDIGLFFMQHTYNFKSLICVYLTVETIQDFN